MTNKILHPKNLIFVFVILTILMVSTALIELQHSKKELLDLMKDQAHTLLETTLSSSQNSILSNDYLEEFLEERLLNNAKFIRILFDQNKIDDDGKRNTAPDTTVPLQPRQVVEGKEES